MSFVEHKDENTRVIVLLDMDCFYAQCERVRLGLDAKTTALALLQWNSVLAVTYPARELYGIQRGDSWDQVAHKSQGHCLAVHVPILTNESTTNTPMEEPSKAYHTIYKKTPQQQEELRKTQIGLRRYHHQGKACLERYRVASCKIFTLILQTLSQNLPPFSFVMERASIDEVFLDITHCCYNTDLGFLDKATTKKIASSEEESSKQDVDSNMETALERGCRVAAWIRTIIWEELGFTMSAGISTNKMMAKLAASYGKPNGQAYCAPPDFDYLLTKTPIRKIRHFGGKLGKAVMSLTSATNMGDVQRLSLPQLTNEFGSETAQMIFRACRGLDSEAVKETAGALVKSIASSKSFQPTDLRDAQHWIALLAQDVVQRVELDHRRNQRYPRHCTLHYTIHGGNNAKNATKSLRFAFPGIQQGSREKLDTIAKYVPNAILKKEGRTALRLVRMGLCAMDFESVARHGSIDNYFSQVDNNKQQPSNSPPKKKDNSSKANQVLPAERKRAHAAVDRDLELAKKLQASFDRENYILSRMEDKQRQKRPPNKMRRIDAFFKKA